MSNCVRTPNFVLRTHLLFVGNTTRLVTETYTDILQEAWLTGKPFTSTETKIHDNIRGNSLMTTTSYILVVC